VTPRAAKPTVRPKFFATGREFERWLAQHGARHTELVVGFWKRASGRPSLTWPESVDAALCHGWIDGVRKRIDDVSYQIRFTPRKPTSIWSAINIARVAALEAEGRMHDAGRAAHAMRVEHKSRIYAYEQKEAAALSVEEQRQFRRHRKALAFFEAQPPGYRKRMVWRVVSAKRAQTRAKRLATLIEASAAALRLD
jgi:uncharacterized protein YdeI (YjbR/CyaY-like superfamily)